MTSAKYRRALARLNLSQAGAARLLGIHPRTSRRFANGESEVPRVVALVLYLLVAYRVDVAKLQERLPWS